MAPIGLFCPSSQPTSRPHLPIFAAYHPVLWQESQQNVNFSAKDQHQNYTYFSSTFNPNICSKVKTKHSRPQSRNLVSNWNFSAACTSAIYQTQFCVPEAASFTPEKNSGYLSHSAIEELLLFPFHRFVYNCRAIQY